LLAAAVVRDFNVGGKSTVYHIEQIPQLFVRFSPVPLLSLCPTAAGPDASQLCVCLGSGTVKKCWRWPMTAVVQENIGEIDDARNVGRKAESDRPLKRPRLKWND
jgi:hypothetical protein